MRERSTSRMSSAESLFLICPPVQSTHSILTVSLFLIDAAEGTVVLLGQGACVDGKWEVVLSGCHRFCGRSVPVSIEKV